MMKINISDLNLNKHHPIIHEEMIMMYDNKNLNQQKKLSFYFQDQSVAHHVDNEEGADEYDDEDEGKPIIRFVI